MGRVLREEVQRRYPDFPVRGGTYTWEEYLPPLSPTLRNLVEAYGMTATAAAETMASELPPSDSPPPGSVRFRHCSGEFAGERASCGDRQRLLALVSTAREHIRSTGVNRATDVRCWRKTGFAGSQPT